MLGDTFTLPRAGGDVVATKINQDSYSAEYLKKDTLSEWRIRVRHSKVGANATQPARDRHNVEVVQTIYAADEVAEFSRKVYVVFENLSNDADIVDIDALADWLILGTNITKLLGWES